MKDETVDGYSVLTVPLEMFFGSTNLTLGTGFIWEHSAKFFLITNWHNFSGRSPFTGKHLSKTAAEPNQIEASLRCSGNPAKIVPVRLELRDSENLPLWLVHPVHREKVDVVALPLVPDANVTVYPVNRMPEEELEVAVGMDLYILGYPYGLRVLGLPIWKRASIASEPSVICDEQLYFLVDTASRPAMSGSPVIRRSWGTHLFEETIEVKAAGVATRFVGVYSGRLESADPLDAQLGLVWPAKYIPEIINGGVRATL